MSHTPGPWRTGHNSKWGADNVVYAGREPEFESGRRICICFTPGERPEPDTVGTEDYANAKLIAAAPDLLKSLKDVLDVVAIMQSGIIPDYSHTYATVFQPALELIQDLWVTE